MGKNDGNRKETNDEPRKIEENRQKSKKMELKMS